MKRTEEVMVLEKYIHAEQMGRVRNIGFDNVCKEIAKTFDLNPRAVKLVIESETKRGRKKK